MTERKDGYAASDPVTAMLKDQGVDVFNHYLSGTSIVTGGRINLAGSELVYKVEPDDTVMIVFYRRLNKRSSLKNSFRDLVGFCALVADNVPAIKFISGKAEPLLRSSKDGISKERLLAMYNRHIGTELKAGWLYFDLDQYRYRTADSEKHHLRWIDKVLKNKS